jgi:L-ribulose-5-phosphate 3-epimerase
MYLGYNSNGMAHHDLLQAVNLLAEIGYGGAAITIDHGPLWPPEKGRAGGIARLKNLLRDLEMRSVIETGARFLLDSRVRHEPTLVSADPRPRIDFYKYAVDCAAELESDCVSLWSGAVRDGASRDEAEKRLVQGLHKVQEYAAGQGVVIAFEPEPGMLIDSMKRFEEFLTHNNMPQLRLTLDVGHAHCQGEVPIADVIRRWAGRLANVHIEDMKTGVHEHLMFGEGEIDFPPILRALAESSYSGGVYAELTCHSREAPQAAKKAFDFLTRLTANA